uniref:HYP effector n=1 Tax=Strongyloides papillosus TaxID=174720 RepID=A0A0N5BE56_STREA
MVSFSYKMLSAILLVVLLSVELYSKPAQNGRQPAKYNGRKEEQNPPLHRQGRNHPPRRGPGGRNPPPPPEGTRLPPPSGETRPPRPTREPRGSRPPCDDDSSQESHEHGRSGRRHGDRHRKGKGHRKHHKCITTEAPVTCDVVTTATIEVTTV